MLLGFHGEVQTTVFEIALFPAARKKQFPFSLSVMYPKF
jgi:hypothetical protein